MYSLAVLAHDSVSCLSHTLPPSLYLLVYILIDSIHTFIILIIINLACPRPNSKSLLSPAITEGQNLRPMCFTIAFVIATAAPFSQSDFVTRVHANMEFQRETGASRTVRKEEYILSQMQHCSVIDRFLARNTQHNHTSQLCLPNEEQIWLFSQ